MFSDRRTYYGFSRQAGHVAAAESTTFFGRDSIPCFIIYSLIILIVSFLVISAVPVSAGDKPAVNLSPEERAWLEQNRNKLSMFFDTEFPPIEFLSEDGTFSGMGADIIAMIEKQLGVSFLKRPSDDWNKLLLALESGETATAPTIVRTPERERYAFFTEPYVIVPIVIISAQSSSKNQTLDDLAGKRVAVVSGYATEKYLKDRAHGRFTVVPMPDVPQALRAASFGQVDAFVGNLAVAAYYIDIDGIPNLKVVGGTDFEFKLSIGVSQKYPLLFSAIEKALHAIPESELDAVRNKWISLKIDSGLAPETRRLLILIAVFSGLLLLGLAGISIFLKRKLNEKIINLKNTQQQLMEHAELLDLATEATQAGVWDYYPEKGDNFLSSQWYSMLGYRQNGAMRTFSELKSYIHPEDLPGFESKLLDYIQRGGQGQIEREFRLRQANGDWCWVLSKGRAVVWDAEGKPARLIGLDINIQSVKETQTMMAQSEAKFRAIFEHAPYAIVINSFEDGRFLDANNVFLSDRGIGKEDLFSLSPIDYSSLDDEEAAAVSEELLKNGSLWNREVAVKKNDGTTVHVVFSSVLLEIEGQKQILSITVDVTERKKAEEALRASEHKLRSIFEAMTDVIWILDAEGFIKEVAPTDASLSFHASNELPGENIKNVFTPEKAGELLDAILESLSRKATVTLDNDLKIGERRVYFSSTISPLTQDSVVFVARDVTDRYKSEKERKKLQEQLIQSQKLEALGTLAGGIAHDFNNMLGVIIGYSELMLNGMEASNPLRKNLTKIVDVVERSANLTRQLLAFARKQTIQPILFDINESVDVMLKMLHRLIGENIDLVWLPEEGPCPVNMDPSQLDQILANLCVNARDAIEDVGKITIKTETVSFDEASCEFYTDCSPGDYIQLTVSDSGCGMDKKTLEHIFEPFFTTKGVGRGTGLGLATIYGVVRQNKGFVHVYSEPGAGTTFNIYLPKQADVAGLKATPAVEDIPKSRGETILMVEDDPTFREMGRIMLNRLGYKVLVASTPDDAIRLFKEAGSTIQLVLTDVVMPDMNGRELTDRLKTFRPEIKHIFMSGYPADVIGRRGVLDEDDYFIQKPFTFKALAAKIREVIDQA